MIVRNATRQIVLCALIASCRQGADGPPAAVLEEARAQLEQRGRDDQRVREGFGAGGTIDSAQAAAMTRTDSANAQWLDAWVTRWGWPAESDVGKEAVQAAFLIVQHAVHDTAFMHRMLPFIREAYRRGELNGGAVAMLTDRLEVKAGRPQIYGTQLSLRNGEWVFDPISDSTGVDRRRRRMGLPPLAEYRRAVDSMLRPPPAAPDPR